MIRRCVESDFEVLEAIINEAAQAYRGVIPERLRRREQWGALFMADNVMQSCKGPLLVSVNK